MSHNFNIEEHIILALAEVNLSANEEIFHFKLWIQWWGWEVLPKSPFRAEPLALQSPAPGELYLPMLYLSLNTASICGEVQRPLEEPPHSGIVLHHGQPSPSVSSTPVTLHRCFSWGFFPINLLHTPQNLFPREPDIQHRLFLHSKKQLWLFPSLWMSLIVWFSPNSHN